MAALEREYVHSVYSRLAAFQQQEARPSSPRIWPNVKRFVETLPMGSTLVDVGCGEAKYHPPSVFLLGADTCPDVLLSARKDRQNVQLILADALSLPFRDGVADGVLLVSVLHHLSTAQRRRTALREAARCLRPGGRMLVCVWSFEQPNASFPSQDVLVPWPMHEQIINGRLPQIKFHLNSTKEQRIIEASIPITVPVETSCSSRAATWMGQIMNRVSTLRPALPFLAAKLPTPAPAPVPPATPRLMPDAKGVLLSGIRRWSPMLSRRLASLLVPVEEQLAGEMAEKILHDAITETMASTREVTFYRYYHVFRRGELEQLVTSVSELRTVQSSLEHANWCVVVEKIDTAAFRP